MTPTKTAATATAEPEHDSGGALTAALTIRQEFAARAMGGFCANSNCDLHPPVMAKRAIAYADALISALDDNQ